MKKSELALGNIVKRNKGEEEFVITSINEDVVVLNGRNEVKISTFLRSFKLIKAVENEGNFMNIKDYATCHNFHIINMEHEGINYKFENIQLTTQDNQTVLLADVTNTRKEKVVSKSISIANFINLYAEKEHYVMKPTETLSNKHQQVILTTDLERDLTMAIAECEHDRIFVIADRNTHAHCMGRLSTFRSLRDVITITIEPSDAHKDLTTLTAVWQQLQEHGATRHSLVICLGGGVVTDLGGMAAATFKRGINFINIPTSLLGMVDASVGGKTGVNFGGLKNEIGVFAEARFVLLCADFLATLDGENLRSGYAEMLKHGLISTTAQWAVRPRRARL